MNKIYKPTLPHLLRTYTTWPFRASYTATFNMSASGHGQLCTFTCSCMDIIITGKNTMTLSRSVRHIVKNIHIQDFFLRPCRFSKISILINIVWMCSAILRGIYIYVYNYIYMIVY